jgi:hypothetical protein
LSTKLKNGGVKAAKVVAGAAALGCVVRVGFCLYRRWMARARPTTRAIMAAMEEIEAHDQDEVDEEEDECTDPPPCSDDDQATVADDKSGSGASGASRKKRRGRARKCIEVPIANGRVTGVLAKIAQEARIRFGTVGLTAYNKNAVRRWVVAEANKVEGLRTRDLMAALPYIELYVFYKTDDDLELEQAMRDLQCMGRIRLNVP